MIMVMVEVGGIAVAVVVMAQEADSEHVFPG